MWMGKLVRSETAVAGGRERYRVDTIDRIAEPYPRTGLDQRPSDEETEPLTARESYTHELALGILQAQFSGGAKLERIHLGDQIYHRFWIFCLFFEHELEYFLRHRIVPDRGERLPVQRRRSVLA